MDRRRFLQGAVVGLLAAPLAAEAQQGAVPRVGNLSLGSALNADKLYPELGDGLRNLGWIEGRNIVVERRYAEGNSSRLLPLAGDSVRMKVDVDRRVRSNPVINAAKQATSTIPIVMVAGLRPFENGFIHSLARSTRYPPSGHSMTSPPGRSRRSPQEPHATDRKRHQRRALVSLARRT
jgi:putative ABC transport system substrate-binding protein